ncbi:uncharacterized protein LOC114165360 [Vigna unguiculata]|uniref:uncharacterized protein LOC114165360 n=1 Tax=Vigna unguiculata TaxID=3917 RepID=UPI0010164B3D|nr:uncharacterized protein LOC114165360 [Vigna unguiculata]
MEDWENAHEEVKEEISQVKGEINQIKDQMGQILEALRTMKSLGESSAVDGGTSYPPGFHPHVSSGPLVYLPHHQVSQGTSSQAFPPYGLPPGYTPPMAEYVEQVKNPFSGGNTSIPVSSPNEQFQVLTGMADFRNQVRPREGVVGITTYTDSNVSIPPHVSTVSVGLQEKTLAQVISSTENNKGKLEILKERLRAIEGNKSYGFSDVIGLSLVPDVVIPPKFKVLEFEKYRGTTCPKSQITMNCRKMAGHTHDEKLFIHFFQDSLAGAALNWYMHLEPTHIHSWVDLADAFIKQYKFNMDTTSDRIQLQNMTIKKNETFKEYAQRWREIATQVEPPLYDKEMVTMFVNTLQPPFYEHMIGNWNISSNFVDIIIIGERIESGIKNGKIAYGPPAAANTKKPGFNQSKKKEVEVHAAFAWDNHTPVNYQIQPVSNNQLQPQKAIASQCTNTRRERKFIHFTPIPMTYTELLPMLFCKSFVAICPMKPQQPPFSTSYDPNATCDYHGGVKGHSTERCFPLKYKVQSLIDAGWLTFKEDKPSIENNPLSGHEKTSANAIEVREKRLVRKVSEIRSSMKFILEALLEMGLVKGEYDMSNASAFHPGAKHSINDCVEFKLELQKLVDKHFLQVFHGKKDEEVLVQTDEQSNLTTPESLVIHFTRPAPSFMEQGRQSIVIKTPYSFPYESDRVVPWKYGVHELGEGQQVENTYVHEGPIIENISGLGGITRSGRFFTPLDLRKEACHRSKVNDGIEKAKEILREKTIQDEEECRKDKQKEISDEEAGEFLKFIQQSEYKVVE